MTRGSTRREDLRMISDLIDGRLSSSERSDAIRRLETDEALYEVFVETARYRDARTEARVLPFRRGRVAAAAGLLAAGIAMVVVLPRLGGPAPLSSQALAKALTADGRLAATLAASDWFDPQWPRMRGVSSSPSADRAFRIGVQSTDLEVALRARQAESASLIAARVAGDLSDLELGVLAKAYERLGASLATLKSNESLTDLRKESETLAELLASDPGVDPFKLIFGRWCEAGRLAANSGNTDLLTSKEFRGFVPRLLERDDWDPEVAFEIKRLFDLLQPELKDVHVEAIAVSFEAILAQG